MRTTLANPLSRVAHHWRTLLSVLACILASVSHARATPSPLPHAAAEPVSRFLSRLPRSVEIAIIVDNAEALRRSDAGRGLAAILTDLGQMQKVGPAWSDLAEQLRWNDDEAFSKLLGSRFCMVVRDVENPDGRDAAEHPRVRRWAAMSLITEDTDAQLKAHLGVAPRKVVDNHAILSIKNYEVTAHLDAGAQPGADRHVTLLLGESGKTELFDEMIGVLARGAADSLAVTDVPRQAAGLGDADLVLAIRVDPEPGEPAGKPWEDFILVAAKSAPSGVEAKVRVRHHALAPHLREVTPSSDLPFQSVSRDAIVGVVESRVNIDGGKGGNPVDDMFDLLGCSEPMRALLKGRQALLVYGSTEADAKPASTQKTAHTEPVANQGASKAPASSGNLVVCMGMQASDAAAFAPLCDDYMRRCVQSLEEKYGDVKREPTDSDSPWFNGVCAGAVRTVPIAATRSSLLGRAFQSDELSAAWCVSPAPAAKDVPAGGWWLAGLGATAPHGANDQLTPSASVRRLAEALSRQEPGQDVKPWFSLGVIRPSRLAAVLDPIVPLSALGGGQDAFNPAGALSRVQEIQWRLWVDPEADIQGTISLKLMPDGAKP